jgi:hypothetical protein
MGTIQLPPDFKEFLKLLTSNDVAYILVGGYAVNYHGYPRATADIDIWVAISPENAAKLVTTLHQFGFASATAAHFSEPGKVVRMGVPPVRIEVLTSISGADFEACFARCERATIDGLQVNVLSRADLVGNKRAAGRPKDLADLRELEVE